MMSRRSRRNGGSGDYWPGFVDAMATLLLVMTFLLSVFVLAQYFLSQEVSGKDTALKRLTRQLQQLTSMLNLERSQKSNLQEELAALSASLSSAESEKKRLEGIVSAGTARADQEKARASSLASELSDQKDISGRALAQVELLNQQMLALRRQIAALETALEASEEKEKESQTRIDDLGKRLNVALAAKVQELSRFRSDFFGRLRTLLANRKDIRVVGDRFVFQSEVLFPSGSDQLNSQGLQALQSVASAIKDLEDQIPDEIDWVLQVNGHTDKRPIQSSEFPSNWELSTARAISVVKYLQREGVGAKHLAAAGFGEFQPLDDRNTLAAYDKNRRIEMKLTAK